MTLYDFSRIASQRMNVVRVGHDEKPIFVYEDHRLLVFLLWLAREQAVFTDPITLVWHDKHDDCRDLSPASRTRAHQLRTPGASERDVHSFVEWDLSVLDDDWLKAAFEMNLVGDAVLIGADTTPNLTGAALVYTDLSGGSHHVRRIPFLWDALAYQGDLSDLARAPHLQPLWDSIGWIPSQRDFRTGEHGPATLVDFDLDCFTCNIHDRVYPLPEDVLRDGWSGTSPPPYQTVSAHQFLRGLWSRSLPFGTIARESPYCGGFAKSDALLQHVLGLLVDD